MAATRWAMLTGEYPPQPGGVADYTRLVAAALGAAGDTVTVIAPPATGPDPADPGVAVVRLPDTFGRRGRAVAGRALDAARPDRVLVQYSPFAFGRKGMNLPFCGWVYRRSRGGDRVELVVHEPYLLFGGRPKMWLVSAAQRLMAGLLLRAASRVWLTIPAWGPLVRRYAPARTRFDDLPVPSSLPDRDGHDSPARTTRPYAVGHFSSLGPQTAEPLLAALRLLLPRIDGRLLLIGLRSREFLTRLQAACPQAAGRADATGPVELAAVAGLLDDCEVMVQPVSGGVSARNTSVTACLQGGRPVVTTTGWLTEPFWAATGAVALSADGRAEPLARLTEALLADPVERAGLAARGERLYRDTFDLCHVLRRLRAAGASTLSAAR